MLSKYRRGSEPNPETQRESSSDSLDAAKAVRISLGEKNEPDFSLIDKQREINQLKRELESEKELQQGLHCEILSQSALLKKQNQELHETKEKLGLLQKKSGLLEEKLSKTEIELTSSQVAQDELKKDYDQLHTLWTEKCIEDCDYAMTMYEKEEKWSSQMEAKDEQLSKLERELQELASSTKQQVAELESILSESEKQHVVSQLELANSFKKNEAMEAEIKGLYLKLELAEWELKNLQDAGPSAESTDSKELKLELGDKKKEAQLLQEECEMLHEQVEELEVTLQESREDMTAKIKNLEGEIFTIQGDMDYEVNRKVADQVRQRMKEYRKEFRLAHSMHMDPDDDSDRESIGKFVENQIRKELTVKIRDEVREELELEIISRFQEIEKEDLSQIDSLLDETMEIPSSSLSVHSGEEKTGFFDELQRNLIVQCRESILKEAEEIWAVEKEKLEKELEEHKKKNEDADVKVKLLTNQIKDKNREIYRMRWGVSTTKMRAPAQQPQQPQHTQQHTQQQHIQQQHTQHHHHQNYHHQQQSSPRAQYSHYSQQSGRGLVQSPPKAGGAPLSPNPEREAAACAAAAAAAARVAAARKKEKRDKFGEEEKENSGRFSKIQQSPAAPSPARASRRPTLFESPYSSSKSKRMLRSQADKVDRSRSPARRSLAFSPLKKK